ncbi:MAG: ferritin [Bacillota bacterium]
MNKKIQKALNEQINKEYYSAYLYLAMSNQCVDMNLDGFANWTRIQYEEEVTHALKIMDFINERGGRVKLEALDKPQFEWDTLLEMFEDVLEHEKFITKSINELVELAMEEKDYATNSMLQWYVDEQVEEEANASEILEKLEMIGDNNSGIFMLDSKLANRVFVDETKEEA